MTQDVRKGYSGEVSEACLRAIQDGQIHEEPPEVIFHLTKAGTLPKILSTRCLWANPPTAMNDSKEVQHALEVAVRVVDERLKGETLEYLTVLREFLQNPTEVMAKARLDCEFFAASFCGRPNRSGQWLNYGDSGRGVALGFSKSIAEAVGYDLVKVDYSIQSQERRIALLIDAARRRKIGSGRGAGRSPRGFGIRELDRNRSHQRRGPERDQ